MLAFEVLEQALIHGSADRTARSATRGRAEQTTEQRTREATDSDANGTGHRTQGGTCFRATHSSHQPRRSPTCGANHRACISASVEGFDMQGFANRASNRHENLLDKNERLK